jgi:ABC-type glycerol-3-phosphate transport system substrate-binding protein
MHLRFLKRIAALAGCVLLAASAAPCPSGAADDSLLVVSGSPSPGLNGVMDDIAELAGFFKEEHVSVTTEYASGAAAAGAVTAQARRMR